MPITTATERVRDIFDDWAQRGRAEGMERGHGPTATQAFARLGVAAGTRYLDIGCGSGYTVRWAADVSPEVSAVGLDVSPLMIERAITGSSEFPGARFVNDAFPSAQLEPGSFDAIFSMEVFYYLEDLDAGLRAVRDLLAPGGRFACVVDFYRENAASHSWADDLGLPLHLLSADEWRIRCETAGMKVIEQTRLHPPLSAGEEPTWKHTEGSLLTLASKVS